MKTFNLLVLLLVTKTIFAQINPANIKSWTYSDNKITSFETIENDNWKREVWKLNTDSWLQKDLLPSVVSFPISTYDLTLDNKLIVGGKEKHIVHVALIDMKDQVVIEEIEWADSLNLEISSIAYKNKHFYIGGRSIVGANTDNYIAKIKRDGSIQWIKTFGGPRGYDEIKKLNVTQKGIFAIGEADDFNAHNIWTTIFLLDTTGKFKWNKRKGNDQYSTHYLSSNIQGNDNLVLTLSSDSLILNAIYTPKGTMTTYEKFQKLKNSDGTLIGGFYSNNSFYHIYANTNGFKADKKEIIIANHCSVKIIPLDTLDKPQKSPKLIFDNGTYLLQDSFSIGKKFQIEMKSTLPMYYTVISLDGEGKLRKHFPREKTNQNAIVSAIIPEAKTALIIEKLGTETFYIFFSKSPQSFNEDDKRNLELAGILKNLDDVTQSGLDNYIPNEMLFNGNSDMSLIPMVLRIGVK